MKRKWSLLVAAAAWAAVSVTAAEAQVQQFAVDPAHSEVGFRIRHLVGKVRGSFDDFHGTVTMDPQNVASTLRIEGTIRTASIDTNNERRDNDLRSDNFFDAEKNPEITFASKRVEQDGDDVWVVADLTMHGVTQEVRLKADIGGVMPNPFTHTPTTGLDLTGTIDRKLFGITWNHTVDNGGLLLGDDVDLDVHLEATVPPPPKAES